MPDYSDTRVNDMIFNVLDSARYNTLLSNNQLNNNQLYFITDDGGTITFTKNNSTLATFTGSNNITIDLTTASNAIADGGGNEIESTYIKTITYSGNSTTNAAGTSITAGSAGLVTMTKGDNTITKIDIPAATASVAGLVNNGAQTIAGTKTFSTGVTIASGTSTKAMFNYSDIQAGTSDSARPVWFAWAGQNGTPVIDTDFTYNPSSNTLKATNFDGLATKATGDANGNNILTTYANSLTLSGDTLTLKNKNGDTLSSVTISASDTKVNVTLGKTTKAYILGTTTTPTSTAAGTTSIADTGVYLGTTAGELVATKFTGDLNGNAATATSATKATYDSGDNNIESTYIKSLSVSGTTLTIKKGDDTTSTITLQDNNTDTKVNVTLGTTSKAYILGTTTTPTGTAAAVTSIADTGVYLGTTAGELVATKFTGELNGNAKTATKATYDSGDNDIESTYIKSLSVSGTTLTIKKGDDTTSTITLQDNNTDTKVNVKARGTTKAYVLGTTTSPTSSDQAVTSVAETGVYFDTTAAKLVATTFKGALDGNATTATSATNDSGSHKIVDHYVHSITTSSNTLTYKDGDGDQIGTASIISGVSNSWTAGGANGPTLTTTVNGVSGTAVAVPSASASASGVVTTGAQTFAGSKTFNSKIIGDLQGTADTATKATQDSNGNNILNYYIHSITFDSSTSKLTYENGNGDPTDVLLPFLLLTGGNVTGPVSFGDAVSIDSLTVGSLVSTGVARFNNGLIGNLTGNADTATKATQDSSGNNILGFYGHSLALSGSTLSLKDGNGDTLNSVTISAEDTKNTAGSTQSTSKLFLIGAPSQAANPQTYSSSKVYVTDGTLTATTFSGNLSGNATTATSATKATQDGAGNNIEETYLTSVSFSIDSNGNSKYTTTTGDGTTADITPVVAQIIRW